MLKIFFLKMEDTLHKDHRFQNLMGLIDTGML